MRGRSSRSGPPHRPPQDHPTSELPTARPPDEGRAGRSADTDGPLAEEEVPGSDVLLDEEPEDDGDEAPRRARRSEPVVRVKRRRRWRRVLLLAFLAGLFLLFSLAGVLWAVTKVTPASEIQTRQVSYIYMNDGSTVVGRVGSEFRQDIPLAEVPVPVRNAVLAAENRTFYSDPGISPRGLSRAVWNNVTGGSTQGGSTITQQYAKNVYLTQERSLSRKLREMVLAVKLDVQYSKDQILEWYLNTIYFGRGAYGIEAAAEVYFGKHARDLTVEEGAVLATSIRSPAQYDPQEHPFPAMYRWDYVMRTMYVAGWLDRGTAYDAPYPAVLPKQGSAINRLDGPNGYVIQRIKAELAAGGIDERMLQAGGLTVTSTIDPKAQESAVEAVGAVFKGQPASMRQALVSIDPADGAVLAWYGGSVGLGNLDYARTAQPVGSAFKPVVLAAALNEGYSLNSRFDGRSPRWFPGGVKITNAGDGRGAQCYPCPLSDATRKSVNTVYFDLTRRLGSTNVAAMGHQLGIPEKYGETATLQEPSGIVYPGIGLGGYDVRPVDMARVYATFANGGFTVTPHMVAKVVDRDGNVLMDNSSLTRTRVLSEAVTRDVTYALRQVISNGTAAGKGLSGGRPAAGKTGSVQRGDTDDNQDAWFIGYTPQLVTAVWVGNDDNAPLRQTGGKDVFGSGLPAATWKTYMDSTLKGEPEISFPKPAHVGRSKGPLGNVQPRSTTPARPSPSASAPPSPSPTPEGTGGSNGAAGRNGNGGTGAGPDGPDDAPAGGGASGARG